MGFHKIIPLIVAAGYGVIVPEQLGYGETDKPTDVKAYSRKKLSAENAAILDKEGVDKVIVFGHDHGAPLAFSFVGWYPERTIALISFAAAYAPPGPGLNIDAFHELVKDYVPYHHFGYWKFFLEDPLAAKKIEDHLDSFVSIMWPRDPKDWETTFCPEGALEKRLLEDYTDPNPEWFTEEEKQETISFLKENGLAGPIMWYHLYCSEVNTEEEKELPKRLTVPYLFLRAKGDAISPPVMSANQPNDCDDLTTIEFDLGHWVSEEDPQGSVKAVGGWLTSKGLV